MTKTRKLEPIGSKLKTALKALNKSQQWLADEAGYDKATVSKVLRNKEQPTEAQLRDLITALGETFEDFVAGTSVEGLLEPTDDEARDGLREENAALVECIEELRAKLARVKEKNDVIKVARDAFAKDNARLNKDLAQMTLRRNDWHLKHQKQQERADAAERHNKELKAANKAVIVRNSTLEKQGADLKAMLLVAGLGALIAGGSSSRK